jgi:predicted enzyme related to lactoylglutathione lyase
MAVGSVAQIHISVTDLDRSVGFYQDVLGIPLLFRVSGQPMAFLASGDVRLYLGVPETPEFTSRVVLYFRVDDIDAEYERLAGHGVAIDPPRVVHRDGGTELWMASFTDPDGQHLVLMQDRPAR